MLNAIANWYTPTFFNWHVDYHIRPHSATGAGMTAERLRGILQRVRPDMVQVDAKGHPGLTSYPTKFGFMSDNYARDTLRIYRDVTRELAIPMSIYYSTLVDNAAGEAHPDWCIIKADGSRDTWFAEVSWSRICFNSGYVDDYMLPQLREIIRAYEPDGFWLDGDVFTARLCYCPTCQARFHARAGARLPADLSSPLWGEALHFLRESYEVYVGKVCAEIHAQRPECLVAVNWLQTLRSPGLAPQTVDWLSGDVPVNRSARAASAEARYIDSQALPGDIMICQFTADELWERLYYKPPVQQAQEAAIVIANGARVFVWTSPMLDGSIHDDAVELLAQTAEFVRARQPYCQGSASVPDVALFLAETSFHASPILRNQPPELDRLLAAQHMLVMAGWHHDIVSDHQLDSLACWPLVIVPTLSNITPDTASALTAYVESGGQLLISAPLAADPDGRVRADFAALTGVEHSTATDMHSMRSDVLDHPTRVFYTYWRLEGENLGQMGTLWDTQTGQALKGMPEAVLHSLSRGRVLTICGDIFLGYHEVQSPVLREVVLRALRRLHPRPVAWLDPGGQLEVIVREREGDWFVHLVNRGADRDMSGNNFFVEQVPPAPGRELQVRCLFEAANVTLEPSGREITWTQEGDFLRCQLPPLGIHEIVHIQRAV